MPRRRLSARQAGAREAPERRPPLGQKTQFYYFLRGYSPP